MSLRIRRGTDAQRTGVTFDQGELVYTTDGQQLWVGNGITQGGTNILSNSAGTGLIWNASTNKFDFNTGNLGLTTSVVSEGANKYFTTQRAQDAAASLFTATGTPTATGSITGAIAPATVTVNSIAGLVIGEPFIVSGTGGIARGLTAGTYYIVSASGTSVVLASTQANATSPTPVPLSTLTTGSISATTFAAGGPDSGITFVYDSVNHVMNVITSAGASSIPTQAGHSGQFLTTNGSSTNWASIITSVSGDVNPALGGNLTLGGYNITGNGSIAITAGNISTGGTISATTGLGGNLALGGYSINGSGNINITGTIAASTGLGANLPLNSYNINGTGNIGITGTIGNGAMTLTNATITTNTGAPTTLGFTSNSPVYIGTNTNPQTLFLKSARTVAAFTGLTDGTNNSGLVAQISRGTLDVPTAVQPGDFIFYNQAMGYDGAAFQVAGAFGIAADQNGTVTAGHVPGAFGVITINATGGVNQLIFDSTGRLTIPNLSIGGLTYYSPNYISVATTNTYNLSTTLTYNMLLVTSASLTATINMPISPTDGQLTSFTVLTNTVTLIVGTGTVSPTFAGSATAGTVFRYVYRATGTTWYRI